MFERGVFHKAFVIDDDFLESYLGIDPEDIPRLEELGLPNGGHWDRYGQLRFNGPVDCAAVCDWLVSHVGDLHEHDKPDPKIAADKEEDRKHGGHWSTENGRSVWVDETGFIDEAHGKIDRFEAGRAFLGAFGIGDDFDMNDRNHLGDDK